VSEGGKNDRSEPGGLMSPGASLPERLARRIAGETGGELVMPQPSQWSEPDWEEVTPGIFCKLLANDTEAKRVSMLVRLLPNVPYPPHTHAGVEELHLLTGELWIDERKLVPGDYNRAQAPSGRQAATGTSGARRAARASSSRVPRTG
jgi:hypothetical protein